MAILTIRPNKDTWVDAESPSTAQGSVDGLIAAISYGTKRNILMEYTLPASLGTITRIDFKGTEKGAYGAGTIFGLYNTANDSWAEATATWNSDEFNFTGSVIVSKTSDGVLNEKTWNLYGGAAVNPITPTWDAVLGLCIKPDGSGAGWKGFYFYADESDVAADLKPRLEVTYTPASVPSQAARRGVVMMMR